MLSLQNSLDRPAVRSSAIPMLALLLLHGVAHAVNAPTDRRTYNSPDEALAALTTAVGSGEMIALQGLFGPAANRLASGDAVQDREDLREFAAGLRAFARFVPDGTDIMILQVGAEQHPFPVPIAKADNGWYFDTEEGIEELLDRRIGENELNAIAVCRGYVIAQYEYYSEDRDNDRLLEFAQRIRSSPGKRDGLYWPTRPDEPASPLGLFVANARAEGYQEKPGEPASAPRPYHGYIYKPLHRQGAGAPGGAFDYRVNDNLLAGFALLAYPVEWGESGIMTLAVSANGVVLEKNLGPDTAKIAAAMNSLDIDSSWKPANDNN